MEPLLSLEASRELCGSQRVAVSQPPWLGNWRAGRPEGSCQRERE
jgi:ribosome modulation factor